jgi:hypothetical protein
MTNLIHEVDCIHLSISGSTVLAKILAASHTGGFIICLDTWQDAFGQAISPSQRPLPTRDNTTHKYDNKHPYLKRDAN